MAGRNLKKILGEDAFTDEFNRERQRKKALEALNQAKEVERQRIASGWVWVDDPKNPRTKMLVKPFRAADMQIQASMKRTIFKPAV